MKAGLYFQPSNKITVRMKLSKICALLFYSFMTRWWTLTGKVCTDVAFSLLQADFGDLPKDCLLVLGLRWDQSLQLDCLWTFLFFPLHQQCAEVTQIKVVTPAPVSLQYFRRIATFKFTEGKLESIVSNSASHCSSSNSVHTVRNEVSLIRSILEVWISLS